ncbi:UDP-N-acetylmuramoyl-tripeptide--D-alanyl-D-alanine ligase [Aquincola sp. MAHUQ-54]|uniref:UDP-N-acetylmuramoyl-tripeptide--D-alanyl-D-alanine ligase n=1 Tax=Aquincola agrisoli TaxID=3119538 RepID=A0AAW9QHE3_9BURK
MMTLAEAAALLPDATLVGDGATPLLRVHSDTRTLQPGDLFVALRGERFDAHDFLPQARAAGAAAALAEHGLAAAGLPGLQVPDTQRALEFLAAAWRRRCDLPLIAVTGSNGKTTVTQMVAAILRAWLGDDALATEGNYNNHIGVPLTLLRLRQDAQRWHRAAVVELGMNHPGEIALLARIAAPTVALVNNAQREHLEFMATVEAVARENGSVIEALGPTGVAVYPADDAHAPVWHELAGPRPQITFARRGTADVTCEALWLAGEAPHWAVTLHTPAGPASLALHVAGEHNVKNALAAAACALAAGAPLAAIVQGLQAFQPVKGRSMVRPVQIQGRPVTLIDDTYNANPDSMRAAVDVLAALPGPRALLIGDMGEVGERGAEFHAEVGAHAQAQGIDWLWAAGAASADAARAHGQSRHFATVDELIAALGELPAAASIVVKGSRFMRMERVVAALLAGGRDAA